MATSRNTKNTKLTAEQVAAETVKLVTSITSTETSGKAAVKAATLESFNDNADSYVKLGKHLATHVASYLPAGDALTGETVAKLYTKDGALGASLSDDDRAAVKSATTFTRSLTIARFDSADARDLFVNGPAKLVARCAALAGIGGNDSPGLVNYYEWLRVMNAAEIAKVKAIPADTLAKWNIFTDDQTGATLFAKRAPVAGSDTSTKVSFKRADAPVIARVLDVSDRDALVKLVADAPFDLDIDAAKLASFTEYVLAKYRLSLIDAPADAPVVPPAKQTISV